MCFRTPGHFKAPGSVSIFKGGGGGEWGGVGGGNSYINVIEFGDMHTHVHVHTLTKVTQSILFLNLTGYSQPPPRCSHSSTEVHFPQDQCPCGNDTH